MNKLEIKDELITMYGIARVNEIMYSCFARGKGDEYTNRATKRCKEDVETFRKLLNELLEEEQVGEK